MKVDFLLLHACPLLFLSLLESVKCLLHFRHFLHMDSIIPFYMYLFILYMYMCGHACDMVHMCMSEHNRENWFSPSTSWVVWINTGSHEGWQAPLPTEPPHQPGLINPYTNYSGKIAAPISQERSWSSKGCNCPIWKIRKQTCLELSYLSPTF